MHMIIIFALINNDIAAQGTKNSVYKEQKQNVYTDILYSHLYTTF